MPSAFPAVSPGRAREVDAAGLICWGAQVKSGPGCGNRGLTAKTVRES